jgi:hypothetical protein
MSDKTKVFISYAREDYEYAKQFYNDLRKAGLDPWLDKESILPGEPWEIAIRQAVRESHFFLALLSSKSVGKQGVVQKEIRWAFDEYDKRPEGEIFIVPARLEKCKPVYEQLHDIQWVDMFPSWDNGLKRILRTIGIVRPSDEWKKLQPEVTEFVPPPDRGNGWVEPFRKTPPERPLMVITISYYPPQEEEMFPFRRETPFWKMTVTFMQ